MSSAAASASVGCCHAAADLQQRQARLDLGDAKATLGYDRFHHFASFGNLGLDSGDKVRRDLDARCCQPLSDLFVARRAIALRKSRIACDLLFRRLLAIMLAPAWGSP